MRKSDIKHVLSFIRTNAPYKVAGRYPRYTIVYEDSVIAKCDWSTLDVVSDICHKMNTAYMEGYLQKERELGVGVFES